MTSDHALSDVVYDCLLPRPSVSSAEWCCRHVELPADANTKGLFRLDLYPHAREWMECCDDPEIEKITIQAASRIGKTLFSLAYSIKVGATDPHPMALADADEKSTRRVIRRLWRMIERCEPMRNQVPPRRRQASDRIECATFELQGAWSGSPATAADYPAYVVILNETDKMRVRAIDRGRKLNEQSSAASEADFRKLMAERVKGFGSGAKLIQISTPTLKGGSWIEAERLAGDNRRRLVPCPHCGHFQELRTGNGKDPGGVRFAKLNGKLDPQTARETAWYECEACQGRIEEEQRVEMLQAGVWCPEGCTVDKRGRIRGTPARPGRHASFGPLSTLHSLLPGITIGRYAQEYVEALTAPQNRREALRNFANSWEGRTWNPAPVTVRASDVLLRMGCELPLGIVPQWAAFLTGAADVGRVGEELIFYWGVSAWGKHARGHLVDYGVCWGGEILDVLRRQWPREQTALQSLAAVRWAIDSSSFTNQIYDLCRPLPGVYPIKGDSHSDINPFPTAAFPEMFKMGFQRAGLDPRVAARKVKTGAADLIIPNTHRSQDWLEDRLTGLVKRDAIDWYSIPAEALEAEPVPGIDLAKHLLGDYREGRKWLKRYDDQELRDVVRYSMVIAWQYTRNGTLWGRVGALKSAATKEATTAAQRMGAAAEAARQFLGKGNVRTRPGG